MSFRSTPWSSRTSKILKSVEKGDQDAESCSNKVTDEISATNGLQKKNTTTTSHQNNSVPEKSSCVDVHSEVLAEIGDPKEKCEKGQISSDDHKLTLLKNVGSPSVNINSPVQARQLKQLKGTQITSPKPAKQRVSLISEIEKEIILEELPCSSSENHNYQKVDVEKLAHAKRRLVITKHLSAEDNDKNEASFEDFSSDDSVADPDFTEVIENATQMEQGSETEESDIEPASKKRRRQPKKWKRSLEKSKRHSGAEFITQNKRIIAKKSVKVSCGHTCKLKCSDRISEEARIQIHQQFWTDQKSVDTKRQFIASHVHQIPIERRRERNSLRQGKRQHTNKYFFEIDKNRINVCKKYFLNTLSISQQYVDTAIAKKRGGGLISPDKRGKHAPFNKISPEVRQSVRNHISHFPVYESHYSRERSKKKYLGNHLNIAKMYRLYTEYCQESGVPAESIAKEWLYSEIFNCEFNYGFKNPDNDTCDNCDIFSLKLQEAQTQDLRSSIQKEYDAHLQDAGDRYKMKAEDKKRSRENNTEKIVMIDLQKCLPTPDLQNSQSFYSLKLWTYNLVIHDSTLQEAHCMMWDESISGRGGNEVASCLLKWSEVSNISVNVKELIMWSDNCPSQNRNSQMVMCYFFLLEKNPHLDVINHKFLAKGHTHMEVDGDHSVIERERKKIPQLKIITPWDWQQVVRLAGVKKSFHVTGMETKDFLDFKSLCEGSQAPFVIRKNTETGEKFLISQVVHFQVRRDTPGILFYKYKFMDDFALHDLTKNTRQKHNIPKSLPQIRDSLKKLPTKKFQHLQKLLKWIPQQFHSFYKNLPHGEGPDVDDD